MKIKMTLESRDDDLELAKKILDLLDKEGYSSGVKEIVAGDYYSIRD